VATVTGAATGTVTAVGNGIATVTAASGSLSADVTVNVTQVTAQLAKISGDGQSGTVAGALAQPLVVEQRDAQGHPIPGGTGGLIANTVVFFQVSTGGGSVGTASATVGPDGRASSTWTLGNGAGTQTVTATAGVTTGGTVVFSATATAGAANSLVIVSGDDQIGTVGVALADSLVVQVADQFLNPVAGYQVTFSATSGGGSVSPTSVATGANGRAATAWTLGSTVGAQTAQALAQTAIPGSPAVFDAVATNLAITGIAPDPMVENAAVTITGTGFDATPGNNTVTIDATAAPVTAASPTSLTVTVPTYDCKPQRSVNVRVSVGAANSNIVSHPLRPASPVNLAVGEQRIVLDPAGFCLQFLASAATESYLIGVQSLSETPSNLAPTRLIAVTGQASPSPPAALAYATGAAPPAARAPSAREARWAAHRRAEAEVSLMNERFIRTHGTPAIDLRSAGATQVVVPPTVAVGDTIQDVRVWDRMSNCSAYTAVRAVVRSKGSRGIWLEDVGNPANGYSAADFDSLSAYFDNIIFDTDTSYFGNPGDLDANARVVILITKQVNASPNLLGFVGSCDFYARAQAPAGNDRAEFFYAKAPDPTGAFGSVYTRNEAFADAPFLIGHELSHIIQFGQRLPIAGAVFTSWLLEGQATLAEEVVGFAVAGRSPGQNYGFAVAFNDPVSTPIDWHVAGFTDLALYYGFESPTTRKANAPHECTWIGRLSEGNTGPCISGREVYGVPWTLLRWISDRFGPTYAGGERGLQRAIITTPAGGYANLATITGVSADTLLAQWAASLYVDDRVPGASPALTIPSWNLVDVFNGLVATARLEPTSLGFATFDVARNVRAGSSAYFLLGSAARPATAVRARSDTDAQLPATMNLWIVRVQ
jgi:hypothetical protein